MNRCPNPGCQVYGDNMTAHQAICGKHPHPSGNMRDQLAIDAVAEMRWIIRKHLEPAAAVIESTETEREGKCAG